MVIPVQETMAASKGIHRLAASTIEDEFRKYSMDAEVEVLSDNKCIVYVPERDIAKIIGKQGKNISEMEKKLGMSIDVQELGSGSKVKREEAKKQDETPYQLNIKKSSILFDLGINMQYKDVDLYIGDEFILSAKAGKTGVIKIKKNNNIGRRIMESLSRREEISLRV